MAVKQPRVAIVHDWLIGGGAERVVLELHHMYPDAPIYTSYATPEWRKRMDGKVRTGFLQHLGVVRKFIPLFRIWWFTHLNLRDYDLVISSSGAEAKGIKVGPETLHINYCHAPTHYYWSRFDQYMREPGFGVFDPLARFGLKLLVGPLRRWDFKAAQRPDVMIANSTHIAADIQKYYKRDAVVIYPPVETTRFASTGRRERHGFVIAGRQTPYKRIDLAVQACTQLGLPLMVLGRGPDHDRLVDLAGPTITFNEDASDQDVERAFQSAEAFLFPGLDDFGIVAVEALAAGTPLIAYKAGGSLDYVIPGKTGLFFERQTVESLVKTLQDFPNHSFDHAAIAQAAQNFSPEIFRKHMATFIAQTISDHVALSQKNNHHM